MRNLQWLFIPLWALAFVLCACGGGGSSKPPEPPPPTVSLAPSTLSAKHLTGKSVSITVIATASAPIDQTVYVTIVDTTHVLSTTLSIVPYSQNSVRVMLATSSALQPGHYTGTLQVNVCFDPGCARPFGNSPLSVPFDITIDPLPPAFVTEGTIGGTYTIGFPYQVRLPVTSARNNFVRMTNAANTFQTQVTYVSSFTAGVNSYLAISPLASLTAGRYTGTVQIQACASQSCSSDLPDTQATNVPFDITVVPLSTLTRRAGVDDWAMFQGDARHRGHVNITVDTNRIVPRWAWDYPPTTLGSPGLGMSPLVVSKNRVLLTIGEVMAIDENDGATLWSKSFPGSEIGAVGAAPPAIADDRVYFVTNDYPNYMMRALSVADGSAIFMSPVAAQFDRQMSPTLTDGLIFNYGGYYGGLYSFDGATGAERFFVSSLPQIDKWTPAADSQYVYVYLPTGHLVIFDRNTGDLVKDIVAANGGCCEYAAPILAGNNSVIGLSVAQRGTNQYGTLTRFDTQADSVAWLQTGSYVGFPAYSDQTVYAVNNSPLRLEARAESDGALLWTWTPPAGVDTFIGDVLTTNNLVFVSTVVATYAIDKATHQLSWSYPKRGRIAMSSNGILFIAGEYTNGAENDIVAFDTQ